MRSHWYKFLLLAICTGFFAVGLFVRAGRLQGGLASQTFRFPDAHFGAEVSHTFQVRNTTADVLQIDRAETSCGCTTVGVVPRFIKPGAVAELGVKARLDKDGDWFTQEVTLHIQRHPPVKLRIEGRVIRELPSRVDFGRVLRGDPVVRRFFFRAVGPSPVQINSVKFPEDRIDAAYSRSATDRRDVEFVLRMKEQAPFGPFDDEIGIDCQGASGPERKVVRVEGFVRAPVEVSPESANFGVVSFNDQTEITVRLSSPYNHPFEFVNATSSAPHLLTVSACSEETHEYRIKLQGKSDSNVLSERINFHLRYLGEPVLLQQSVYAMDRRGKP